MSDQHCSVTCKQVPATVPVSTPSRHQQQHVASNFRCLVNQTPAVVGKARSGDFSASAAPAIEGETRNAPKSFSGLGVMVFVGPAFVLRERCRQSQTAGAAGRLQLDPEDACRLAIRDRYFSDGVFDDLFGPRCAR